MRREPRTKTGLTSSLGQLTEAIHPTPLASSDPLAYGQLPKPTRPTGELTTPVAGISSDELASVTSLDVGKGS